MKYFRLAWACVTYVWNGDTTYWFPDAPDRSWKRETTMYTIKTTTTPNGGVTGYALINQRTGEVLKVYSRARDARRGADRLGLSLA